MVNLFRILCAITFASLATASIAPGKGLLHPRLNKQLSVRGGAGPLDPDLVTKAAIGALLAQGTFSTLAPGPALEQYGNEPTPVSTVMMRRVGVCGLAIAAMAGGMIFKGWDISAAAGAEALIWGTELLYGLLNDESTKIGYDKNGMIAWFLLHLAEAYFTVTDASCASSVVKAFSGSVLATCAPLMFFPTEMLKLYGFADDTSLLDKAYVKVQGAGITAIGVYLLSVVTGTNPTKALGYAYVPATLLTLIMILITKEADDIGGSKTPSIVWLIFNLMVVGTLAID